MTVSLQRATLTPFNKDESSLDTAAAIQLDFNPETLSIRRHSEQARNNLRRGAQTVQDIGTSHASLSFDAVFDMTRPVLGQRAPEASDNAPEKLDVRNKTGKIVDLVQGAKDELGPRVVQFAWGTMIFKGTIKSLNETIDYFSPEGVPLRAKLSITIDETDKRYETTAKLAAKKQKCKPKAKDNKQVAENNGLDSVDDIRNGSGYDLDPALDLDISGSDVSGPDAQSALAGELGVAGDSGIEAAAGVSLGPQDALDVFGPGALSEGLAADVDLGRALGGRIAAGLDREMSAGPPNSWAPDGPPPGSRAAELAGHVAAARAAGARAPRPGQTQGTFKATALAGTSSAAAPSDPGQAVSRPAAVPAQAEAPTVPLPVRGSPPIVPARFGPPPPAGLFSREKPDGRIEEAGGMRLPQWERLSDAGARPAPGRAADPCCEPCGRRRRKW